MMAGFLFFALYSIQMYVDVYSIFSFNYCKQIKMMPSLVNNTSHGFASLLGMDLSPFVSQNRFGVFFFVFCNIIPLEKMMDQKNIFSWKKNQLVDQGQSRVNAESAMTFFWIS